MGDGRSSWPVSVSAALLVGSARLLLIRRRPSAVLRLLAGGATSGVPAGPARRRAPNEDQALAAVRSAGRLLRADCLPQAIALTALLHRGGAAPVLILGCRRYGANDWGAHAWVEVEGHTLDPVEQPHHAQLARLSATNEWEVGPAAG